MNLVPAERRGERPRLLLVMQLPPPLHGASAVNASVARSSRLAEQFACTVLPLEFASSIQDIGKLNLRKLTRLVTVGARLVCALARERPEAVYFTLSPTGGAFYRDVALTALMRAFRVTRVYHLHGYGIRAAQTHAWKRALYRLAFADATVILLSPALADDLDGVADFASLRFVGNGIEDRSPPARDAFGDPPRLLFLSHLLRSKGPLVLIDALARLHGRGIAFEATLVGEHAGDGTDQDVRAEIANAGLSSCVRYIGPVYGEDKHQLFERHDIFVHPTMQDAFPLVLLEAMRAGMPVVASAIGGIPDIVADGETGLLVPARDPDALAERLQTLIEAPSFGRELGRAGRRRFLERFTVERFEHDLVATLTEAVRAGPKV